MPYIGNITQDFNVNNAMLDTDSVTSIKIVDGTIEGADIAANLDLSDSQKIRFGAGNDLQIYHNGSHSYIDDAGTGNLYLRSSQIVLQNTAGDEDLAILTSNGAVKLYFNDSKKFETTNTGVTVTGALATTSLSATGGITGTGGNFILGDSSGTSDDRIKLGAGGDLHVYHDGTDTYVSNATGDLKLFSVGGSADDVLIRAQDDIELQPNNGEAGIKVIGDGAVELYYDNTKRLETDASGVKLSNGRFYSAGTFAFIESSDTSTATLTLKKSASGADSIDYLQCRDSSNNIKLVISGSGDIDIEDNTKLKLGASDDLEIYHSGTDSYIENDTNQLYIRSAQGIYIQPATNENGVVALPNGAVELYHDNSKKFETASTGITVTGDINITDDLVVNTGNAEQVLRDWTNTSDSDIYALLSGSTFGTVHEGAHNGHHVIALRGNDSADSFAIVSGGGDYQTDSTYDTLVCRFHSNGVINIPDNGVLKIGTGNDLQIYHDGSNSYINNFVGNLELRPKSGEVGLQMVPNGTTKIYYDGSKKLETTSTGVTVTGRINSSSFGSQGAYSGEFGRIRVGADTHGNTIRCITDTNLNIAANNTVAFYIGGATDGSSFGTGIAFFNSNGFNPAADNTFDLGGSSNRWANLYTTDLKLSNEGSQNDVDGTWGNYTIQEGHEDLFLINHRTGKKFKFNLTEVA